MELVEEIYQLTQRLKVLNTKRRKLMSNEFEKNPYASLADLSRKYRCSKDTVGKIRDQYYAKSMKVF